MIRRAAKFVGFAALVLIILLLIVNAFPALVGADQSYTVQSGSMEPAIHTGSIVFVKDVPAQEVEVGDVITFAESRASASTTHRVIEKHDEGGGMRFVTKGDANDARDPEPVYPRNLIGVVILSIPYIGYVSAFVGTRLGWIAFVVLPMSLLILNELWELWKAGTRSEEHT